MCCVSSPVVSCVVCVQLEYRLQQERYQRGELERSRRKLEGDGQSTQESLAKLEKMKSGLEDLIKRLVKDTIPVTVVMM